MRRVARARVPIFATVLLLGLGGLAWGSISVDSVNDEAAIAGGAACGNRTGAGFAASWADRPAGACALDVPPKWGAASINVLDIGTATLQTGVNFTRPSSPTVNFPVQSSGGGGCGSIDICNCDSAEVLSARVFNSYKRRACSAPCAMAGCPTPLASYQVEQKIGAGGTWTLCTGLGDCPDIAPDQAAQTFLRISRTDAGAKCGFVVIREPQIPGTAGTAYVRLEADNPCGLWSNWAVPTSGNTGTDLNLVNLIQIKRNGINGLIKFDIITTPGAAPITRTVTTAAVDSNTTVANNIKTQLEGAGVGFRISVAANAAAGGSVLDTFAGSPYEVGQPVVVVENAGFRVAAIHIKVVSGQEAIMEDLTPDPSVPTLS
ncbi:MAG TPA: hypothetical protein VFW45_16705, partial [Candidatus Polarisedimenticolia bacterium]|nr:hypothetical protein [Candidatus Polarisedimenticolia bacterium]